MIVKFDHISYSCAIFDEENTRQMFNDYEVEFHEIGLKNMSMKYKYMKEIQEKHNIMLLTKASNYPVEITAYDKCIAQKATKYAVNDEWIEIYSCNPEQTASFFYLLGMKQEEDGAMCIKPMLDERALKIKIYETVKDNSNYLDQEGFGSLAFVVDNAKKQRELFVNNGYECSEIEELNVNGKRLKIFFTNSPTNEIIEFIGLR